MENNNSFIQNLKKWSFVCIISAAPSFVLALKDNTDFDPIAMILGVVVFIFVYSFITSSKFYIFICRFKNIYNALRFSYILKIIMAIVALPISFFPIDKNNEIATFFLFPDMLSGVYAVMLYFSFTHESLSHARREFKPEFFDTFVITLIEGIILSLMILLFSVILLIIFKIVEKCKLALKAKIS